MGKQSPSAAVVRSLPLLLVLLGAAIGTSRGASASSSSSSSSSTSTRRQAPSALTSPFTSQQPVSNSSSTCHDQGTVTCSRTFQLSPSNEGGEGNSSISGSSTVLFTVNATCTGDGNLTCEMAPFEGRNDSVTTTCRGGNAIRCQVRAGNASSLSAADPAAASSEKACFNGYYVSCPAGCGEFRSCWVNCSCTHDIVYLIEVTNYVRPEINLVDKYVTLVTYCIGFPGNIVSFIVWIQRRMRHSSGFYLAALAMDDFVFLSLHVIFEMHTTWSYMPLNTPVFCQLYRYPLRDAAKKILGYSGGLAFPVLFMTAQYLGPLLVLGFTTERYISICHPFKREKYCTVRRAKMVVAVLVALAVSLSGPQGYFYYYNNGADCGPRMEVAEGGSTSLLILWNLSIEILIFFLVPLAILVLNILVIAEMRRLSRMEQVTLHHGHSQRTSATTVMLLAVSFYLILTVLPVTIAYTVFYEFEIHEELKAPLSELAAMPRIQRHIDYQFALTFIREIGITHYAFNVIIYLSTGKAFRKELRRLLVKGVCGKVSRSLSKEYSSLRSSLRKDGSKSQAGGGKSLYVSINGHSTTVVTTLATDTTLQPLAPSASNTTTVISEPTKDGTPPPTWSSASSSTRAAHLAGNNNSATSPLTSSALDKQGLTDNGLTDNSLDTTETNL